MDFRTLENVLQDLVAGAVTADDEVFGGGLPARFLLVTKLVRKPSVAVLEKYVFPKTCFISASKGSRTAASN